MENSQDIEKTAGEDGNDVQPFSSKNYGRPKVFVLKTRKISWLESNSEHGYDQIIIRFSLEVDGVSIEQEPTPPENVQMLPLQQIRNSLKFNFTNVCADRPCCIFYLCSS